MTVRHTGTRTGKGETETQGEGVVRPFDTPEKEERGQGRETGVDRRRRRRTLDSTPGPPSPNGRRTPWTVDLSTRLYLPGPFPNSRESVCSDPGPDPLRHESCRMGPETGDGDPE